jgi:hypothetical protein
MISHALLLLLQQGPPPSPEHATASKIALEYLGFISFFAVYGSLGFHFQVLKDLKGSFADRADKRAAAIGFVGSIMMFVAMLANLLQRAEQKHISFVDAIGAGGGRQIFQIICVSIFFICFALAVRRMRAAWSIAGLPQLHMHSGTS